MTESEKPLEGEAADVERSRLRDERLNAQGAVGVSWRSQFLRCFDGRTTMTDERGKSGSDPAYTIEIRENGKRLSQEAMVDPFICTRISPRGWRVAWAVLRRRYEVEVLVGGDRDRVEAVLELNPDYLGPPGSKSREAWNAQLNEALRRV